MTSFAHSLHPPVGRTPAQALLVRDALRRSTHAARAQAVERLRTELAISHVDAAPAEAVTIPLTTVSMANLFDATVCVGLRGTGVADIALLVDSGNSVLVLPSWDAIANSPSAADYTVLGTGSEPWGCPAKVVRGPIELPTADGGLFEIADCVFYACTGPAAPGGEPTTNFGVGCLAPWTSSPWNQPPGIDEVLKAPLAHAAGMPFAVFEYAAAADVLALDAGTPRVDASSRLTLSRSEPPGFTWLSILPRQPWMALRPLSLAIDGQDTAWPADAEAIAMVDTGGTCVFLSDPDDLVCAQAWPPMVDNPPWTRQSVACRTTAGAVRLKLADAAGKAYAYTIDPAALPAAARGQTLVMCHENSFMWGRKGLNTGGLSALVNAIAIDYAGQRVGFKPR